MPGENQRGGINELVHRIAALEQRFEDHLHAAFTRNEYGEPDLHGHHDDHKTRKDEAQERIDLKKKAKGAVLTVVGIVGVNIIIELIKWLKG